MPDAPVTWSPTSPKGLKGKLGLNSFSNPPTIGEINASSDWRQVWALYNRLRHGEWRLRPPRIARGANVPAEEEWTPEETGARAWLEEADALAREARFAEAIHHLLFRSIEDIASRRPALVRRALTSRELAAAHSIPERARALFAAIARLVERSLFGGRPVNEGDWLQARQAYSDFAVPTAWRA